jgi:hypothetical protein
VVDFLKGIDSGTGVKPDFYDGYLDMKVLEAGIESAEKKKQIDLD